MPKSSLEKQIERQMKQEKQLAEKRRRDEQKRAREDAQAQRKAAIREQASSVVNGQPLVEGFRIMDSTSEEMLKCLLECGGRQESHVNFSDDMFPPYVQMSVGLELEKLTQYGMIGGLMLFNNGGMLDLLPPSLSYFEDKEAALERQAKREEESGKYIVNYGNMVFGNVSGSTLTVDNSIHQIEQAIEEHGGEDKEELYDLLEEVKELISNIEVSRTIPKQKKLFERISDHLEKHGWFYGAVVQLLGTAAFNMIGG